jgi:hypothetical protein
MHLNTHGHCITNLNKANSIFLRQSNKLVLVLYNEPNAQNIIK